MAVSPRAAKRGRRGVRRLAAALGGTAVALAIVGCGPPPALEPTPRPVAAGAAIVVVTEGGSLPTKPVPRTPSPSPTTDIILMINTVVAVPTRTPGPAGTPSPTVGPPPTSTPRPSPTRMIMSGPPMIPSATPSPRPTRTPREVFDPADIEDTRVASLPPTPEPPEPDAFEPNETATQAEILSIGEEHGELTMHHQGDVDVFKIPVEDANMTLVVSVTGRTLSRYRLELSSPKRPNAGRTRFDGTVAQRSVADVGEELGSYYATVRTVGALPPEGPYSISASLVASASTPTAIP